MLKCFIVLNRGEDELNCTENVKKLKSGELGIDAGFKKVKIKNQEAPGAVVEFRPFLNCLNQEDSLLTRTLRDRYFIPGTGAPYRFSQKYQDINHPFQTQDIRDLVFGDRVRNGFFIEAGSYDAETMSVSLYFEKEYNWTGLLVEANPMDHLKGVYKNRKATYVNSCLGLEEQPHYATLDLNPKIKGTEWNSMAGLSEGDSVSGVKMQCLPLYSLIQAAGNPTVNLLILDIEGAEFGVLKTLPWDKVDIQVMTVETDLVGETGVSGGSQDEIRQYIISKGYRLFKHRHNKNFMTGKENNDLFVREDIVRKLNIKGYPSKTNHN